MNSAHDENISFWPASGSVSSSDVLFRQTRVRATRTDRLDPDPPHLVLPSTGYQPSLARDAKGILGKCVLSSSVTTHPAIDAIVRTRDQLDMGDQQGRLGRGS